MAALSSSSVAVAPLPEADAAGALTTLVDTADTGEVPMDAHRLSRQDTTGMLRGNVRRSFLRGKVSSDSHCERFIFPVFAPRIIDSRDTLANLVGLGQFAATFLKDNQMKLLLITSTSFTVFAVFLFQGQYTMTFIASFGTLFNLFPLALSQTNIMRLSATSFMSFFVGLNLIATLVFVGILYDNHYLSAGVCIVLMQVLPCVLWDTMPQRVRDTTYWVLILCALIAWGGVMKVLIDHASSSANVDNQNLSPSIEYALALRTASCIANIGLFNVYLFWGMLRRPAKLALSSSRIKICKAPKRDLHIIREQVEAMRTWEYDSQRMLKELRAKGGAQNDIVRFISSPIPPLIVNTRNTIGRRLLGPKLGNLSFYVHKFVPGYAFIGLALLLGTYVANVHAFLAKRKDGIDDTVTLTVFLAIWSVFSSLPLANVRLLQLIASGLEVRFFITIKVLCCGLMMFVFPQWTMPVTVSAFALSLVSLTSDAWPTFIVEGRGRALGFGLCFSTMLGVYVGIRNNTLFGGSLEGMRNPRIHIASVVSIDLVMVIQSLLLSLIFFTGKNFLLALARPDCFVLVKAPLVSIRVPRSQAEEYQRLFRETVQQISSGAAIEREGQNNPALQGVATP